jgi:hypothetical protein
MLHDRVEYHFTPKNIMEAIENAPSEEITVFYNKENVKAPFRVNGGSGYEAWVMPRVQQQGE